MNIQLRHFIFGVLIGALLVSSGLYWYAGDLSPDELRQKQMADYYANSVATLVSPHSIRERMTHGDESFILVDTRAQEDYEREHIVGAINIDSSLPVADVVAMYRSLPSDKQVIIYCYSASCMNGRKVGNLLAQNGVYVQEMTVGWNEWRYAWESWNYDTEWDEHFVEDYVVSGSEPGVVADDIKKVAPCVEGELSC
jgi:rhodanese-related sulfurtransferase